MDIIIPSQEPEKDYMKGPIRHHIGLIIPVLGLLGPEKDCMEGPLWPHMGLIIGGPSKVPYRPHDPTSAPKSVSRI